jgi:hypothetical protein
MAEACIMLVVLFVCLAVWWIHGVVQSYGGLWVVFDLGIDAGGDAALEQTTWAGWGLSLLGVSKAVAEGEATPFVGGARVGNVPATPLPPATLARSSAGVLSTGLGDRRGVAFWASDSRNNVASARAVCFASVEFGCVGSRAGGLGRALWQQASALVAQTTDDMLRTGKGSALANVTVIVIDGVDDTIKTDIKTDWSGMQGSDPAEPLAIRSPGCAGEVLAAGSLLARRASRNASAAPGGDAASTSGSEDLHQASAPHWPEHARLVHVAARTSRRWRRGAAASLESAALLDLLRAMPSACAVLHVPDFRGLAALPLQARLAGEVALQGVRVNVQVHGTDAQVSLGYLLDRPRKGPGDVSQNVLERLSLSLADSTMLLTRQQAPRVRALAGPGTPRGPWIAANFVSGDHSSRHPGDGGQASGDGAAAGLRRPAGRAEAPSNACPEPAEPPPGGFSRLVLYGRLKFLKGLHLVAAALHRLGREGVARMGLREVLLLGHKALDGGELSTIKVSLGALGLSVVAKTHFGAARAGQELRRLAPTSIVVLPSLLENQPFAVFDVVSAGACFLVSDVWGHAAVLEETTGRTSNPDMDSGNPERGDRGVLIQKTFPRRHRQFFAPNPVELARALERAFKEEFRCANHCRALPNGGRADFMRWHQQAGFLLGPKATGNDAKSQEQEQQQKQEHAQDAIKSSQDAIKTSKRERARVLVVVSTTLPGVASGYFERAPDQAAQSDAASPTDAAASTGVEASMSHPAPLSTRLGSASSAAAAAAESAVASALASVPLHSPDAALPRTDVTLRIVVGGSAGWDGHDGSGPGASACERLLVSRAVSRVVAREGYGSVQCVIGPSGFSAGMTAVLAGLAMSHGSEQGVTPPAADSPSARVRPCRVAMSENRRDTALQFAVPSSLQDQIVILDADAGQRLRPHSLQVLAQAGRADPDVALLVGWSELYHPLQSRAEMTEGGGGGGGVQTIGVGAAMELLPMAEPMASGTGLVALQPGSPHWDAIGSVVSGVAQSDSEAKWTQEGPEGGKCLSAAAGAEPDGWDGCGLQALIARAIAIDHTRRVALPAEQVTSPAARLVPRAISWRRCVRVSPGQQAEESSWKGAELREIPEGLGSHAGFGSGRGGGGGGGGAVGGGGESGGSGDGSRDRDDVALAAAVFGEEAIAWMSPHSNRFPWRDEASPEMRARCKLRVAAAVAGAPGMSAGASTWMHYAASLYEAMEGAKTDWEHECD